jgi:hypothetical protein
MVKKIEAAFWPQILFPAALTVFEIIVKRGYYEYIFELSYLAINHRVLDTITFKERTDKDKKNLD